MTEHNKLASPGTSKPRILHVSECMGAGVATALMEYVQNFPDAEHHLLYGVRAETSALPEGWERKFSGINELPPSHLARVLAVRRRARWIGANAVHAHSSLAGLYSRLALRSKPTLRQIYTPHCFAFERTDLSPTFNFVLKSIEKLLATNTDTFAACSQREATLASALPGRAKVIYIPNAGAVSGGVEMLDDLAAQELPTLENIPLENTAPENTGQDARVSLKIAAAGRIGAQKDPGYFLSAVAALRQTGHQVRATWIGGGDSILTQQLRDEGISVTGWVERTEVLRQLAQQDLYLHTAAWEGFPLAVIEAVHCNVPVVVRNIPAFDAVALPLVLQSPEQLASHWNYLELSANRKAILNLCKVALAQNSALEQRKALTQLYQGDAPTSAQGIPREPSTLSADPVGSSHA